MDFKSLYCFTEFIRPQSFSAMASALNLVQLAVSKTIQALEEELGVSLSCKENGREKRQVRPAVIGGEVYHHALNLLRERNLLLARTDGYRHVKSGTLHLGLALFGSDLLSHMLFGFYQERPDVGLLFLEQGSFVIEQSLHNNGLGAGQLLASVHEDFDNITLCDYPLVVLMLKNRVRHDALMLKSLQHELLILFGAGFSLNETIRTACRNQGFTPSIVYRTGQWNLVADMVACNMGIALLPKCYAWKINPGVFAAIPLVEPEIR